MVTTKTSGHTEQFVDLATGRVHVLKGGTGDPVLILHHDIGNPGWLPFYATLAKHYTVYVPEHPGYGKSDRPDWARSVRDLASIYLWLLNDLGIAKVNLVGLGFGGWIAAEMASMDHHSIKKLVLVGAMGVQPREGEILDQFLVSSTDYVKAGFHDVSHFEKLHGEPDLDLLEFWEIAREMTTRIAWKPYMFDQSLPHLLPGIKTPTLLVWGKEDKIVPPDCAKRYLEGLPNAKLEVLPNCGFRAEVEKADQLAKLTRDFFAK
jgi:pimeloyl-ACP methyl ester carboxylesterase